MTDAAFKILALLAERGPMTIQAMIKHLGDSMEISDITTLRRLGYVRDEWQAFGRGHQITDAGRDALQQRTP